MRSLALVVILATFVAVPARADPLPALCRALHAVGDEAEHSGQPQRLSSGVDLIGPADCRPGTDNAATRAFCTVAGNQAGLAWRLQDCVETLAADPIITTRDEHAERRSRNAITHLTAKLGHGVRLDLKEAAGRYDIVVWAAK